MSGNVVVESSRTGQTLVVESDGSARTHVMNPVETRPESQGEVTRTVTTVTTSGDEVVAANDDRIGIQLQNLDDTISVNVRLGVGTPTADDLRIGPGEIWSPPAGVSYGGAVTAIVAFGTVQMLALEFTGRPGG